MRWAGDAGTSGRGDNTDVPACPGRSAVATVEIDDDAGDNLRGAGVINVRIPIFAHVPRHAPLRIGWLTIPVPVRLDADVPER